MKQLTRLGAAFLLALGLAVPAMAPAAAHGGKIDIELGTDGAGGVSVALTWAGDQHPVEESAVVIVQAASDAGEEVGPVTLTSASEGVGWYRSEPALLDEGHWTVTARVKEPKKAKVEAEIDVVPPPSAPPSEPASSAPAAGGSTVEADAVDGTSAGDGPTPTGGPPGWTAWALVALAVAGAVTAVVVLRRRAS
ncbi:hypothetical protein [Promicromonospora kroppenstedtii]|uniref:hypothetical protein n=1 Tax=Promicromonospora kroppenstedtii TaxID=440482 RepID=UPI0004B6BAA2|nr:hypothetical protein [Promicromonospora kroppenstedtii]